MMYPFQWPHVYIPVLPRGLLQVLQAPMPFIIGMPTCLKEEVQDLPDTVVTIDLDRNTIDIGAKPLPDMPSKAGLKLIRGLVKYGEAYSHRPRTWLSTVLTSRDLAFKFASRPSDDDDDGAAKYSPNWDKTRETFFRFFVSLLSDYRKYLVFPSPDNPKPPDRFLKDAFVASHSSDMAPFLTALVESQAFINFVDERMQPENANAADIVFFDQSIDAKHNRSRLRLSKFATPFLDSTEFEICKTQVAVLPDVSDLPAGLKYKYSPFPRLNSDLYLSPRSVPSYADDGFNTSQAKLRRNPAVVYVEDVPGDAHSFESSIYTAWFLVFTAGIGNLVPLSTSPAVAFHKAVSPTRPAPSAASKPPGQSPPPVPLRRKSSVSRVSDPDTAEEMHQLFLHHVSPAHLLPLAVLCFAWFQWLCTRSFKLRLRC